jgi:hypothetical protein
MSDDVLVCDPQRDDPVANISRYSGDKLIGTHLPEHPDWEQRVADAMAGKPPADGGEYVIYHKDKNNIYYTWYKEPTA